MASAKRRGQGTGAQEHRGRGAQGTVVCREAFPHVAALLRGYLHEDFAQEHGSAIEARDAFLGDCSPGERRAFRRESARLVGSLVGMGLPEARRVLTEVFGSAWSPASREDIEHLLVVPDDCT